MYPNRFLKNEQGTGGTAFLQSFPVGAIETNGGGRAVPDVPPRPHQSPSYAVGLSPYTSAYSGSYSSPYGGYPSPYMSGGYTGGYGNQFGSRYGQGYSGGYDPENRFIATAEESSQAAFQSIESVVRAFSSVSMMLDSTLSAVYSSFRAVLGVAENFSRMKNSFSAVMSALAIMKTFKWALKKLLYLIGIEKENPAREAWSTAFEQLNRGNVLTEIDIKKTRSSWPILMFFAMISAAPYLIWRILKSLTSGDTNVDKRWAIGESEHYLAVAEYNFLAASDKELSFKAGQQLILAPKDLQPRVRGWVLASADGIRTGLVPSNYIRILGKQPPKSNGVLASVSSTGPSISSAGPSINRAGPGISNTSPSVSSTGPSINRAGPSISNTSPIVSNAGPSVSSTGPSTSSAFPCGSSTAQPVKPVDVPPSGFPGKME